jgi:hypothetical protein
LKFLHDEEKISPWHFSFKHRMFLHTYIEMARAPIHALVTCLYIFSVLDVHSALLPVTNKTKLPTLQRLERALSNEGVIDFGDKETFPDGNQVSGDTLAKLLYGFGNRFNHIQIRNGRVLGDVWLQRCSLYAALSFTDCEFTGSIELSESTVSRSVEFFKCGMGHLQAAGCQFMGAVKFTNVRSDGFNFEDARFSSWVSFMDCQIGTDGVAFDGASIAASLYVTLGKVKGMVSLNSTSVSNDIVFANVTFESHISGANIKVDGNVGFAGGECKSTINFSGGSIKGNFIASSLEIGSRTTPGKLKGDDKRGPVHDYAMEYEYDYDPILNFYGMRVAGDFDISRSTCFDHVELEGCEIGGTFRASQARFRKSLDLSSAKIAGSLDLESAEFTDSAFFTQLECGGNVSLDHATIKRSSGYLDCREIEVEGGVSLNDIISRTPITFVGARVKRGIRMTHAKMLSSRAYLNLWSVSSGDDVVLDDSTFMAPVTLTGTSITGEFSAARCTFAHHSYLTNEEVPFHAPALGADRAHISGNLTLDSCVFFGGLSLANASIQGEFYGRAMQLCGPYGDLLLKESSFGRSCDLSYTTISGWCEGYNIKVGETLALSGFQAVSPYGHVSFDRLVANNVFMTGHGDAPTMRPLFRSGLSLVSAEVISRIVIDSAIVEHGNSGKVAIDLNRTRVKEGGLYLLRCKARGDVSLTWVDTHTDLWVFSSNLKDGNFYGEGIRCGGAFAILESCVTSPVIDLQNLSATASISFSGSRFGGSPSVMRLVNATSQGILDLTRARFACECKWQQMRINGIWCKNGRNTVSSESNAHVEFRGGIDINQSVFTGPIDLSSCYIESSFSPSPVPVVANFSYCVFERGLDLNGFVCLGDFSMENSTCNSLSMTGCVLGRPADKILVNLRNTKVSTGLFLNEADIWGKLDGTDFSCQGSVECRSLKNSSTELNFAGSVIAYRLDLAGSDLRNGRLVLNGASAQELHLSPGRCPSNAAFQLRQLDCKRLFLDAVETTRAPNPAEAELGLLRAAEFDPMAFQAATQRLQKAGHSDDATSVFLEGKRTHRRGLPFQQKVVGCFLDVTSNYMKTPGLLFIWSLGWIGIGYFTFGGKFVNARMVSIGNPSMEFPAEPSMEFPGDLPISEGANERQTKCAPFSPLWYSIYLFLPFDNIPMVDTWKPSPKRGPRAFWWATQYMYVHQLMGWFLLTAAVGGVVSLFSER